ncbi:MAG: conjugal transfer protein TraX [Roseburia sp.]|nr:conjugal transfer protein TraX [Roseburia sp.]
MEQSTTQRGLSGFALKYLAMALMILDHIHYFFAFTGKIPLLFSLLGRSAAPLFLFCIIEGFTHTRDRRKYFLRIYLLSILMGAVQFSFYNVGYILVRPDGFFPQNQMLASFSILIVVLQGFDWCARKKWKRGLSAILIPILLPYIAAVLMAAFQNPIGGFTLNLLAFTALPLHSFIMDGGTATLLFGVVLWLSRRNKYLQASAFAITCILWDIVRLRLMIPELGLADFFASAYEWMEIFAIVPMLCYNGTRGHGSKHFFYWFYPAHIYVLYALSCALYRFI